MTDELQKTINEMLRKALAIETMEEFKAYQARLQRQRDFIDALEDDWEHALEDLDLDDSDQYSRRTLIRTLFAMVEGTVSVLKQRVLEEHEIGRIRLSAAEYAVLSEEAYDLKESGQIRTSDNYQRLKASIKFIFPIHARALGGHFEFQPRWDQDLGWQSFCRSIGIRNRLVHPKSLEELFVSDSDLKDVLDAETWFRGQLDRIESIVWDIVRQFLSATQEQQRNRPAHA